MYKGINLSYRITKFLPYIYYYKEGFIGVIGPLHECKKVCPCTKVLLPSGIRAWIKHVRIKIKMRGKETGKTEARRLMERKSAQQNKKTTLWTNPSLIVETKCLDTTFEKLLKSARNIILDMNFAIPGNKFVPFITPPIYYNNMDPILKYIQWLVEINIQMHVQTDVRESSIIIRPSLK